MLSCFVYNTAVLKEYYLISLQKSILRMTRVTKEVTLAVDLEIRDLMQLVCPGCGEINLHQDQVEVFFRDDAEIGG